MSRHCCTGRSGKTSVCSGRSAMVAAQSVALSREHDLELRSAEHFFARASLRLFELQVSVQRGHVIAEDRDRRFEEVVDGAEPPLAGALLDERVSRGVQCNRDRKALA